MHHPLAKANNVAFGLQTAFHVMDHPQRGVPLCANVRETPTPLEFSVEGGEERTNGFHA